MIKQAVDLQQKQNAKSKDFDIQGLCPTATLTTIYCYCSENMARVLSAMHTHIMLTMELDLHVNKIQSGMHRDVKTECLPLHTLYKYKHVPSTTPAHTSTDAAVVLVNAV